MTNQQVLDRVRELARRKAFRVDAIGPNVPREIRLLDLEEFLEALPRVLVEDPTKYAPKQTFTTTVRPAPYEPYHCPCPSCAARRSVR